MTLSQNILEKYEESQNIKTEKFEKTVEERDRQIDELKFRIKKLEEDIAYIQANKN